MLATSTIELISSIHGEQRRVERAISKRDLRAAVKNGSCERQIRIDKYGQKVIRYKYTFADVVYITDETSTLEITSYVLPIPLHKAPVTIHDLTQHNIAKQRIRNEPSTINSHTVLIIDNSGSMRNADVEAHRSRADAVSYAIATEFIAKRIHNPEANITLTDLVTVIEMGDNARIVFDREPISWILYNKIVERAQSEDHKPQGHGYYLPALEKAYQVLQKFDNGEMQLVLFFLSDGRPSDTWVGLVNPKSEWDILESVRRIGDKFKTRLSFLMVGFAGPREDFTVMMLMTKSLQEAGASGGFQQNNLKEIGSLSSSLAKFSSTITNSRIVGASKIHSAGVKQVEKKVELANFQPKTGLIPNSLWEKKFVNVDKVKLWTLSFHQGRHKYIEIPLVHVKAAGIAFRTKPFGRGAERLVYQLREIDSKAKFVGTAMVAKESKHEQYDSKGAERFNKGYLITQRNALNLAEKFNQLLDANVGNTVPRVTFLKCFLSTYVDRQKNYMIEYVIEKQLDPARFTKYNNNTGGVRGQFSDPTKEKTAEGTAMERLTKKLGLMEIIEEDEEDEDDDDDLSRCIQQASSAQPIGLSSYILDEDVPQAFTHFTYRFTKRRKMVCDLQGVLDTSCSPPLFEFTDPAIHFEPGYDRKSRVYGRTDFGRAGMQEFFKTHKCNLLCKLLGFEPV